MNDLGALLERVKAATGTDREIDRDLFLQLECELIPSHGIVTDWVSLGYRWMPGDRGRTYHRDGVPTDGTTGPEFTASIDAALALVERKLPGWDWSVVKHQGFEGPFFVARIAKTTPDEDGVTGYDAVIDHGAPLAIVAALLAALATQRAE